MPKLSLSSPAQAADPGVCGRCAARSPTCCVIPAADLECCFPLSTREIHSLQAHAGEGCVAQAANSPRFIAAMQALFPGESLRIGALFPAGGSHMRLAVREDGSCLFLEPEGCGLSRELRPRYCRVYPFWINRGMLVHFASKSCHAQTESRNLPGLMALFGMGEDSVREHYDTLRSGWGLPKARKA